jgi:ADP-heptose:LPS heptosyltransferase
MSRPEGSGRRGPGNPGGVPRWVGEPFRGGAPMGRHVLVARQDSVGDVLLAGPAVRAVAAGAGRVTLLCGPRGRDAARLLPGVDEVVVAHAGWIDAEPEPVTRAGVGALVDRLTDLELDQALILTSFHQSPLPLALLLRMAGVPTIAAVSVDYPGSLLDVRHRVDEDVHEVERGLSLAATLGYRLPEGDDGRLAVRRDPAADVPDLERPYLVVHPGASVPARSWAPERHAALVEALAAEGRRVVVTGGTAERPLTARVAGGRRPEERVVTDLGGRVDLAGLAEVLAGAEVVVVGNTGPAHLAAAVGTPVVSLFAPVVPAVRWRPWGVRHVLLGDQAAACAGSRARMCPVAGHPCLDGVPVEEVVAAVGALAPLWERQEVGG